MCSIETDTDGAQAFTYISPVDVAERPATAIAIGANALATLTHTTID